MDWSGSGQGQVTHLLRYATFGFHKMRGGWLSNHQLLHEDRTPQINNNNNNAPISLSGGVGTSIPLYVAGQSNLSHLPYNLARTHAQTSATSKLSLQSRLHTLKMETLTCMSWPTRHSVTTDWHQLQVEGGRCLHFATWAWQSSVSTMMSPSFRQKVCLTRFYGTKKKTPYVEPHRLLDFQAFQCRRYLQQCQCYYVSHAFRNNATIKNVANSIYTLQHVSACYWPSSHTHTKEENHVSTRPVPYRSYTQWSH